MKSIVSYSIMMLIGPVAPMTGRVADTEKDRLVLCPRLVERFAAPRKPIDWIIGVLKQIWSFLIY